MQVNTSLPLPLDYGELSSVSRQRDVGAELRPLNEVTSPNGLAVVERQDLQDRFASRMSVGAGLNRRLVSYQGNRYEPGLRWMKYKEGFSRSLVRSFLHELLPERVLDPFSGIGTVPLVAAEFGTQGVGIEIMPVGVMAARAMAIVSDGIEVARFEDLGYALLDRIHAPREAAPENRFRHVRLTDKAFSETTESDLAKAREFISRVDDRRMRLLLDFACMSVLEEVSYTRKDGQYLRWDYRSGRPLRSKVYKGSIKSLSDALESRLSDMVQDAEILPSTRGGGSMDIIEDSCLQRFQELPNDSFDVVFTSPPYANRYDYTRTYALELAWLGLDQHGFSRLRQSLITATVENRSKRDWLGRGREDDKSWLNAVSSYETQAALQEVIECLRSQKQELSNPHVVRLLEGYFLEMSYLIAELGRVTRAGGIVIMVNDNVQYHGEQVPVDLILSDFAEKSGFECENIWMLPKGKGNSSQQMGGYGRNEIRKCIYQWRRRGA